jgi:ankyrin repeat protein
MVKDLLDKGADVNAGGAIPLIGAARYGSAQIVKMLLDHHADPDSADGYGNSALVIAITAPRENTEVVHALLRAGARVDRRSTDRRTPLMWASLRCRAGVARELLDGGADAGATADAGETAMLEAAKLGCTEVMKLLIAKGVDVNYKDQSGMTALSIANKENQYAAKKLLISAGAKQ